MGPWGVRAMQGSLSPQDYPIWYTVHLLLHRGGSKPQLQAHDGFLPFITTEGKALAQGLVLLQTGTILTSQTLRLREVRRSWPPPNAVSF